MKKSKNIVIGVACVVLVVLLAIVFGSCGALKHAHERHEDRVFTRVMQHDTTVVRVDSIHSDTVLVPGDPVYVDCNDPYHPGLSATPPKNMRGVVKVDNGGSPMETFVFDTIYQTKEKYVVNDVAVKMSRDSLRHAQDLLAKNKGKVNSGWRLASGLLALLLIIFFLLKK